MDPPIYAGFARIFAWTAGIDPEGRVTDPGSMLFIGDLGAGDEILIAGDLRKVGMLEQVPSEWDDTTLLYGPQYLFALTFLDPRLSALGNALRIDFPAILESMYDSPLREDVRNSDDPWSDPGLIGLTIAGPASLALLGLGLVGLGVGRQRAARE